MDQEYLKKLDCGLFHCPISEVYKWDKNTYEIIKSCKTQLPITDYTVDIKVHMLMPEQYPCIPNWHYDMVPRDIHGKQDFSKIQSHLKMYLWLSGDPLTEFQDGTKIKKNEWKEFDQTILHRGTVSDKHQWRMFIRLCPSKILPIAEKSKWKRRHSQVYLNSNNFSW